MPPERSASSDDAGATLILMRHGETAWNRERRVMGDLDVPLTDEGRAQCEAAAGLLEGFGVTRIVSSPLVRAAESAAIVGTRLGLPVRHDPRLVEVRFGQWQGLTYEEVARDPRYAAFAADPVGCETPGGDTVRTVQERGLEGLAEAGGGGTVLFVTHGDIIRALLCHFLATPLAEYRRIRADNGGLSAVSVGRGAPEVKFLNVLADQARSRSLTHWSGRP
jgi:broad specificity phosphatase PhoE